MDAISVSPLSAAAAAAVAGWRYPPPYDVYDIGADPLAAALFLGSAARGYFQLCDGRGELLAFCCYGAEARVPGGDYAAPALDVGIGVRPDLTGRGQGMRYLGPVLAFGVAHFRPTLLRLSVASFNLRAIRLYERAGFRPDGRFVSTFAAREFILMTRPAEPPAP